MQDFTQLGIAGATLLILFFIVKYFISAMSAKDSYIQDITNKFSETVNNHLVNENLAREQERQAMTKIMGSLDEHTKVLSEVLKYAIGIDGQMKQFQKDAAKIKYGRRKTDKLTLPQ